MTFAPSTWWPNMELPATALLDARERSQGVSHLPGEVQGPSTQRWIWFIVNNHNCLIHSPTIIPPFYGFFGLVQFGCSSGNSCRISCNWCSEKQTSMWVWVRCHWDHKIHPKLIIPSGSGASIKWGLGISVHLSHPPHCGPHFNSSSEAVCWAFAPDENGWRVHFWHSQCGFVWTIRGKKLIVNHPFTVPYLFLWRMTIGW